MHFDWFALLLHSIEINTNNINKKAQILTFIALFAVVVVGSVYGLVERGILIGEKISTLPKFHIILKKRRKNILITVFFWNFG